MRSAYRSTRYASTRSWSKQGDKLLYLYDFGDDWMHVIKLESVQPRVEPAPRAVCVDGRRPGPGEDCGGVSGYE